MEITLPKMPLSVVAGIISSLLLSTETRATEPWYPIAYPDSGTRVCHQGDLFENKRFANKSQSPVDVSAMAEEKTPWRLLEAQSSDCLATMVPVLLRQIDNATVSGAADHLVSIEPSRDIVLNQFGNPLTARDKMLRSFSLSPMQATGFHTNMGETLEVLYEYTKDKPAVAPEIWIHSIRDFTWAFNEAQKVTLSPGLNRISVNKGGDIYIASFNEKTNGDIRIKLQSGGHPMPMFVLGKNSQADLIEMYRRYPASANTILMSDKMQITLPTEKAKRYIDDPVAVLQTWDKILELGREQYGLTEKTKDRHRVHFIDESDGTGWMWAWNYRLGTGGDTAIKGIVNSQQLQTNGWGAWHEYGHLLQLKPMTWNELTEVTVNLTSLYIQRSFGLLSRLESEGRWENVFNYLNAKSKDFDTEQDVFVKVAMFWQLDLAFGTNFYKALGSWYRDTHQPGEVLSSEQKKQKFVFAASFNSGYDLTPFFSQWGIKVNAKTQAEIDALDLKALDKPIWLNRDSNIQYIYDDLVDELGQFGNVRNMRDGLCLSSQGGEVKGEACIMQHPAQGWMIDGEGHVQNMYGQCLTAAGRYNSAPITLGACEGASQWHYRDDKLIQLKGENYAIDSHGNGIVKLYELHGYDNQQWSGLIGFTDDVSQLAENLRNGGAEEPKLQGWLLEQGEIRSLKRKNYDNIDPAEGSYFFTGRGSNEGAHNALVDQMSQRMAISPNLLGQERVVAQLTFKGNSNGKGDFSLVSLAALDEQGKVIGQPVLQQTQVTSPQWLDYQVSLPVPINAQALEVRVKIQRGREGTSEIVDAHLDQFELVVAQQSEPDNRPPVAQVSVSQSLVEGEATIQLSGAGSYDPDGDTVSYRWQQLAGPTVNFSHPTSMVTQVSLPATAISQQYRFQLLVQDEHGEQHQGSVEVKQQPITHEVCQLVDANAAVYPAWEQSKTYWGGDMVSYGQLVWKAKQWTKGNAPDISGLWELVSEGVTLTWQPAKVYTSGNLVRHAGRLWQAKQWLQGSEPGKSSLWLEVGPSDC
ncbi:M60 family metallopeptidase [Aeromonas sp. 600724]|uniref:M60 family metallopeptidase n=1 Tax=Aeromonas sp. 600724 TaxID=2712031 RepID=UPI003BA1C878